MNRVRESPAVSQPIDLGRVVQAFTVTVGMHLGLLVLAPSVVWWFILLYGGGRGDSAGPASGVLRAILDATLPVSAAWPVFGCFLAVQVVVAPLTAERLRRERDSMSGLLGRWRRYLAAGVIGRVLVLLALYLACVVLLAVPAGPLLSDRLFWNAPGTALLAAAEAAALLSGLLLVSLVSCLAVTAAMLDGLGVARSVARSLHVVRTCWRTLFGMQFLSVLLVVLAVLGLGLSLAFVWVLVLVLGREVLAAPMNGAQQAHAWLAQHRAELTRILWPSVWLAMLVSGVTAAAVCYREAPPAPPDAGGEPRERVAHAAPPRLGAGPLGLT